MQPTTARDDSGRMRFAGDRARREAEIERFREDHANLRSKGYSEEAAQQAALNAQETGERPQQSRRYQMLNR